jgi:hypothetical protein
MSRRLKLTSLCALFASGYFTGALLFAGIAVACEGGGGGTCTAAPSVTTTAASFVTYSSAYLNGDVNANGCQTTYLFEIKKNGTWHENSTHWVISENSNEVVQEWEPFLQPNTTYEFKLKATNEKGTTSGSTVSFTTPEAPPPPPPSVTTEAASGVTSYSARLNASVNPNGYSTTYKFEYGTKETELNKTTTAISDLTASQKVTAEVSLEPGTKYYFRIYASNANGFVTGTILNFTTSSSPWKIKETLNPGSGGSYLYDVSCEPSTSVCTSVGKSTSSGVDSPVALRWNGTSWSEQAAAKKSGATHTRLFGVDCPSEIRCLAVGNYQSSEGPTVLSEIWNEGKWNVQTTPTPTGSTSSEFAGIGCNNTAECTGVGSAMIGGVQTAVAERWKSPTWALSSVPIPEGAKSSRLDGVDCLWSNFCVAVGRYTDNTGTVKNLVMFWNEKWSLQTAAEPEGAAESTLLDVACTPTPNRCTAVGAWKNGKGERFTLAYRFNGVTTWALQSTPNPSAGTESLFQDVSCATETACTASGSSLGGGSTKTLAEVWNGTSWSIQGTPNPSGATFSSLFGVSCRSTTCMGVGWSTNGSGANTTLSEFRE